MTGSSKLQLSVIVFFSFSTIFYNISQNRKKEEIKRIEERSDTSSFESGQIFQKQSLA
jgi:hypothetical protein